MKNKIILGMLCFFTAVSTGIVVLALNVTPIQVKLEVFKYEYGKDIISTNIADYINANQKVISQAQLNFSEVKNEIGLYPASVTYLGVEYPFYIKIVDTTKPVVKLKNGQVQFNVAVGTTIDAIDLLEPVEDNSDVIAYFENENEEKVTSKTFSKEGHYIENIIVYDSSDNHSSRLRVKIVAGSQGSIPSISGIDEIEISVGSYFNPMAGVIAKDGKGNIITQDIKIIKNNVNVKEEGIYEVIYTVTNASGNSIQRSRKVVVVK